MEGFRYYDVRRWSLPSGDLSETDRYLTAARVTRNGDGTYSYARQLVGERMCYHNIPVAAHPAERSESHDDADGRELAESRMVTGSNL